MQITVNVSDLYLLLLSFVHFPHQTKTMINRLLDFVVCGGAICGVRKWAQSIQDDDADLRTPMRENPGNDDMLKSTIIEAIARKPKGHDFDYSRQTLGGQMSRHMSHTGG